MPRYPELSAYIRDHVLKRGTFTLASGATSDFYLDGKIVSHGPIGLRLAVPAFVNELSPYDIRAVGGLELGAVPLVAAVVLQAALDGGDKLSGFTVRKATKGHGTQRKMEGIIPAKGSAVAVLDDVVTTGGSTLEAVDAAEEAGLRVVVAVCLVDRDAGAREALGARGIEYRPLVTLADLGIGQR